MSRGYLLDTNVISEPTRQAPAPQVLDWLRSIGAAPVFVSVVSVVELRFGIERLPAGERRARLERWLEKELLPAYSARILEIDGNTAQIWGRLKAAALAAGIGRSELDNGVAATAVANDLTLATRNVRDFAADPVAVINPWDLRG